MEKNVEKGNFSYCHKGFFSTQDLWKKNNFSTGFVEKIKDSIFPQKILPHSTGFCGILQTGVDVCGNVTNVILQIGIAFFNGVLHFIDRVKDGGMILIDFLTNFRST